MATEKEHREIEYGFTVFPPDIVTLSSVKVDGETVVPSQQEAVEAARYLATCLGGASARGGWSRKEIGNVFDYVTKKWPWVHPAK